MCGVGDKGFNDITVLTEAHTVVAREAHQDIADGDGGDLRGNQQRTLKRGKEELRKPEKGVQGNCGRRDMVATRQWQLARERARAGSPTDL